MKIIEEQLNLFKQRKHQRDEDAAVLESFMLARGHWMKRADVAKALDWKTRRVRAAREHCRGFVIFGKSGLCHMQHATTEEVKRCRNKLFSQSRTNAAGGMDVEHAYHSLGRSESIA